METARADVLTADQSTTIDGDLPAPGSMRLPEAFLAGAPRTGTTSLAHWLSHTPGAFVPVAKEPKTLAVDRPLDRRALDWYAAHYADAPRGDVLVDASPQYLASPHAPRRIAALCEAPRLVATLREPVDRALSQHAFHTFWGAERRPFETAMADELADPDAAGPHGYLATSRYAQQVRRYLDTFSADQLLVVRFDDLRTEPAAVLARVLEHFGLDPATAPSTEERLSPTAEPRHPLAWRATRRWRLQDWQGRLGRVARAADARNMRPARSKVAVAPWLRQQLTAEFADDVAEVERLTGLDLTAWRSAPT